MPRRFRTRRFLKWAGLAVCVVLLVAMIVSNWWLIAVGNGHYSCWITKGALGFAGSQSSVPVPRWMVIPNKDWADSYVLWIRYRGPDQFVTLHLLIPLWMLLLLSAVSTYLLWRRDRRHSPGHCQRCGYDLTGNVTSVCSECGEPFAMDEDRPATSE